MLSQKKFTVFVGKAKAVVESHLELEKLKAVEKLSDSFSSLLSGFIIAAFSLLFLTVFSFFASILLSELTGSYLLGYGIVAGTYLLLLILCIVFRKKLLKSPIQDKIIHYFYNEDA